LSLLMIASVHQPHAQQTLPVIKATSALVDIRNGSEFSKGFWRISPQLKPDVYTTSKKDSIVTFYTDIDSISFLVTPSVSSDFIILLNGRDSALTRIAYKPTFLEVLKMGRDYDLQDHRAAAQRSFMSAGEPELQSLRTRFALDSIAGPGEETTRLLSILHWVHSTFRHDGSKDAPQAKSIEELMMKCAGGQGTMDCGSLANVLKNCYLALGYPSRRIVCLPKDSTDVDCHSIDVVYSSALGKWLWMDPTFDAYVMDDKDRLLGIAEVRERLVSDASLKLNPDANWNHVSKVEKDYYLYSYMAKNLYALEYFHDAGALLLTPVEYDGVIPRTRAHNPSITHNPGVFWAVP
jgi:hypothetical protein